MEGGAGEGEDGGNVCDFLDFVSAVLHTRPLLKRCYLFLNLSKFFFFFCRAD